MTDKRPTTHDIAILGAGPAGMAAAAEVAAHGATVVVLDEQARPGGQIYRNVEVASPHQKTLLGPDYVKGADLTQAFRSAQIDYRPGCTVWDVTQNGQVVFSQNEQANQLRAKHLILATGATERPVPLPGWTLPGVMTAGAAQILLKSGGLVAHNPVLVGCGPLIYLLAAQMIAAGSPPKAIVETQSFKDMWRARAHLGGALRGWRYLLKGAALLARITRAGVKRYSAAHEIVLAGTNELQAVQFTVGKKRHEIRCEQALLHMGVVPNTQMSRLLRLDHSYDHTQRCFVPKLDDFGQSSAPTISIAGDGAGIGGAQAAALSGRIAALGALQALDRITEFDRDQRAQPLMVMRRQELAARPFLDRAYPPSPEILAPADDTLICRCEEVTAGQIRQFAKLGSKGPNQAKVFGRAGMGPCQGRFCGLTMTEILAQENGQTQEETGALRIRAPLKPVTLGELVAHEAVSKHADTPDQNA